MGFGFRLLVGAWCATSCLLAAAVTITGHAVDENEAGIAGVRIQLEASAGGVPVVASTNQAGEFRITVPGIGSYVLGAEHDGYYPIKAQTVEITEQPSELHVVMNHVIETSTSVDVKATTTPVDVDRTSMERRITGVQMMDVPFSDTRNLRNAMKLIPGTVEDVSGGLHFDGGAENQTLYVLDGFDVNNPLTGDLGPRFSIESVRSLDYQSGRYSPEYGKGSSGVLAIRTEVGDDQFRASATNFVPGFDTKSGVHLGSWTPRANLSGPILKGRAWFADSLEGEYDQPVIPGLPAGQNTATSWQVGNLLHGQFNLKPGNIFYADFLVNTLRASRFGLGALSPVLTTIDNRERDWFYAFKDQIYIARGTLLEVGFGEQRTLSRSIPQGHDLYQITLNGNAGNYFVDSVRHSRRDQFLSNLYLPPARLAGSHQLKFGLDIDRLHYSADVQRTGYDLYGVSGTILRSTTFGGSGAFELPSVEASFYLADQWTIRKNLVAEGGIRQDWDELIDRSTWSPRVSLSWAPFGSTNTRIAGGFGVTQDAATLRTFAHSLDQFSLSDVYSADGTLLRAAALKLFEPGGPRLSAPTYRNWSLSVDRVLPHGFHVSGNLLRRRGDHGLAWVNTLPSPIVAPPNFQAMYGASWVEGLYQLSSSGQQKYDSAQISVHQALGGRYEWFVSYNRSRAYSTEVLDRTINQYLIVDNNAGPQPWDTPNRLLSWAYLPTPLKDWAVAYLFEARSGFPYSIQHDTGEVIGAVNSGRFPAYMSLDLHLEWRFHLFHERWALRGGANNITDHNNPTVVNSIVESPNYLNYYGSEGRHFVARIRWLGKYSK